MSPLLSILVPSLVSRRQLFSPLKSKLNSMASDRVEVLVAEDDARLASGTKRNALLDRAAGEYIAFVDDDDDVADDYAEIMLTACVAGPDVVSLPGLKDGGMANHTCAWKASIARQSRFGPIGYMDDLYWYWPLHRAGLINTEIFINRVLYFYNFSQKTTANQTARSKARTKQWTGRTGIGYYRTADGMIWRDAAGCQRYGALRDVVNGRGEAERMSLRELTEFARLRTR